MFSFRLSSGVFCCFFFPLCDTSSPILLEFNTLCIHFAFSEDPEETQIPEALFLYCSLVSGTLLHNFCISQPLPTPIFVLSAQQDHDSLNRLPFLVLQEMVPRQKSRRAAGLTSLVFLLSDVIVLHCLLPTVCLHLNM